MEKAIDDADDFELDVEDVTIDGDEATAKVKGSDQGEERVRDFEFVREGAGWRATSSAVTLACQAASLPPQRLPVLALVVRAVVA